MEFICSGGLYRIMIHSLHILYCPICHGYTLWTMYMYRGRGYALSMSVDSVTGIRTSISGNFLSDSPNVPSFTTLSLPHTRGYPSRD
jgi:hypothetical protein